MSSGSDRRPPLNAILAIGDPAEIFRLRACERFRVQLDIERVIEADRAAARGLKIMTVHKEPLDGDEALSDGEIAFDR